MLSGPVSAGQQSGVSNSLEPPLYA